MASVIEMAATVRCSFCGKQNTEVEKVVAGPGVHICNECVAACNAILAHDAIAPPGQPRLPYWDTMTDEQILAHIPRIAALEGQVERSLLDWVRRLRDRGVTWERIGSALGMTRQSAWERFSGEE